MTIHPLVSSVLRQIAGEPGRAETARAQGTGSVHLGAKLSGIGKMLDGLLDATRTIAGNVASQPPAFSTCQMDAAVLANPGQALRSVAGEPAAATKPGEEAQLDDTTVSDGAMQDKAGNSIPEGWTQKKWDDFKQLIHANSVDVLSKYFDKALTALRA